MAASSVAARQPPVVDRVFRALSNETRRQVVEHLSGGERSVGELAAPFDMALPSFVEHLRVLEDCGIVRSRKSGRIRTYELSPSALQAAEGWLAKQRSFWERRLDQHDEYVLRMKEQRT